MSKYNNGLGCHNGVKMSQADPSAVFVRKVNPSLALGDWQAFREGFDAYGETRQDAIANVTREVSESELIDDIYFGRI